MKPLNDCNSLNNSLSSYIVSPPHHASPIASEHTSPTNQHPTNRLKSALNQFGTALLKLFDQSQEPRISKRFDRWGNIYFSAYDPVDRTYYVFTSEPEIRIWLEQRYYR